MVLFLWESLIVFNGMPMEFIIAFGWETRGSLRNIPCSIDTCTCIH